MNSLLMGGQACVFYGAAEFSRDLDLVILLEEGNLRRLDHAFAALDAVPIAVPKLSLANLARGHAAHFRCRRGTFPVLSESVDLLSLPDLEGVEAAVEEEQ